MSHNIVIKNKQGSDVIYNNVSKVNLLDTNDNEVVFSEQKPAQTKTITPTTSEQVVNSDDGFELTKVIVKEVTSTIDENIKPQNIKAGVSILGVTGNVTGGITDLDYIKYHDDMIQIETGKVPPTDTEYEQIINKGYKILDYIFRGVIA